MLIIGIDPGKSGGVAWTQDGMKEPLAAKMPDTVHELVDSMPKNGVASMFTFGQGLGKIEGVLAALAIPYEWVSPQKWQGTLRCQTGGDKNLSKRKALELFPRTKWTHATADAALICEYGRRTELQG